LARFLSAQDIINGEFEIGDPAADDGVGEASGSLDVAVQGSGGGAAPTEPPVPPFLLGQTDVSEIQDPYVQITANFRAHVWHLDRIDQKNLPLSDSFEYASSAGRDVEVYVLE